MNEPAANDDPRTAIVVVAAGSGSRLGAREPKAFVELAGRTILSRSLDPITALVEPVQVIVVVPAAYQEHAATLVDQHFGAASAYARVVVGGNTRQESVSRGLAALGHAVDVVLVHDAARAFTPRSQFERVIAAVRETGAAAIPGLSVTDTIKRVDDRDEVRDTVDRSALRAVQTPQGFVKSHLVDAYAGATDDFTDDAALIAEGGHTVHIVDGDANAFKITTPWDFNRARHMLSEQSSSPSPRIRTGIGTDVHAFDNSSELWLAGLHWPGQPGLAGHSDGDAVCHALVDALLSAAGLGDIGSVFGTADPRWEGGRGTRFLSETRRMLAARGYEIVNASVQIIGNSPKFSPRRDEAQLLLSEVLGAPVSLSATTTDALGFTGRGEGIAAIANVLIQPRQEL